MVLLPANSSLRSLSDLIGNADSVQQRRSWIPLLPQLGVYGFIHCLVLHARIHPAIYPTSSLPVRCLKLFRIASHPSQYPLHQDQSELRRGCVTVSLHRHCDFVHDQAQHLPENFRTTWTTGLTHYSMHN